MGVHIPNSRAQGGGGLQPVLMRPNPQLSFKTWGGGAGPAGGPGGGVFLPGSGGGVSGASSHGQGGGGLGLGSRSPSWWNQSWFYNPLECLGWTYQV